MPWGFFSNLLFDCIEFHNVDIFDIIKPIFVINIIQTFFFLTLRTLFQNVSIQILYRRENTPLGKKATEIMLGDYLLVYPNGKAAVR